METNQNPKIAFYVRRSFGEKLNASFDFLKENRKVLLKYMTYLILPFCLVYSLLLNTTMNTYVNVLLGGAILGADVSSFDSWFWLKYYSFIICSILCMLLFTSLVFALVKLYNDREDRLNNLTFDVLRPLLLKNLSRLLSMGVVFTILMFIIVFFVMFLFALSSLTLLLTIPLLFAFFVALSLSVPVYLFEEIGIFQSLAKGIRLGFATWGGVFGVMMVMGVIASILMGVVSLPWYLVMFLKVIFNYSSDFTSSEPSVFYDFFVYILSVIMAFCGCFATAFSILGSSYQYAHATEKMDSITIEDDIDNFEKL